MIVSSLMSFFSYSTDKNLQSKPICGWFYFQFFLFIIVFQTETSDECSITVYSHFIFGDLRSFEPSALKISIRFVDVCLEMLLFQTHSFCLIDDFCSHRGSQAAWWNYTVRLLFDKRRQLCLAMHTFFYSAPPSYSLSYKHTWQLPKTTRPVLIQGSWEDNWQFGLHLWNLRYSPKCHYCSRAFIYIKKKK